MYILCTILIILFVFFIAICMMPIDIYVKAHVIGDNVYNEIEHENSKKENQIELIIKIFKIIPIYSRNFVLDRIKERKQKDGGNKEADIQKKDKQEEENISDNKEKKVLEFIKNIINQKDYIRNIYIKINKLLKNIKIRKLVFSLGFNTEDYVKNSYINASLCTIVCMLINGNQEKFDMKRLYYQVYISDYNYYFIADSKISFKLLNNRYLVENIRKLIVKTKNNNKQANENNNNEKIGASG